MSYILNGEAYIKLMLHAAKYRHRSVNGILVGRSEGQGYVLTDAFPLFHQMTLSPMLEVACQMIDAFCQEKDVQIVGYYHGNERMEDTSLPAYAQTIANKIESECTRACVLMIDGKELKSEGNDAILLMLKDMKRGWVRVDNRLDMKSFDKKLFSKSLQEGAQHEVYDFDEHFEDIEKDWRNPNVHLLLRMNV